MAVGFIGVYDIMERVIGKVQVQTKSAFKKGQANEKNIDTIVSCISSAFCGMFDYEK